MSVDRHGPDSARRQFIEGCVACVPTVVGYLSIGFSAGAMARVAGMSVTEVALMSLVLYAGSGQFIVASMLQSHAAVLSVWVAIFFVNLRHLLLSAYLAPYFKQLSGLRSFLIGSQLTDETFGVASVSGQERGRVPFPWMLGLNLTAYLNWLIGNVAGALAATLIPASMFRSLQFALVAMFIGLIVLQVTSARVRRTQIAAAVLAMVLLLPVTLLIGKNFAVVVTAVLTSFIALGASRWTSTPTSSKSSSAAAH